MLSQRPPNLKGNSIARAEHPLGARCQLLGGDRPARLGYPKPNCSGSSANRSATKVSNPTTKVSNQTSASTTPARRRPSNTTRASQTQLLREFGQPFNDEGRQSSEGHRAGRRNQAEPQYRAYNQVSPARVEPAAPANRPPDDDELLPISQVSWKRNTRNLETPPLTEMGYIGLFASPRMEAMWCFSRGIRVSVIKCPNHDRL
ncbi:hypothetical protein U1Q18_009552 [Sarracenia purpurea var. burkii]